MPNEPEHTRDTGGGTPTQTTHPQTWGVPVALRYTYHQPHKAPIDIECFHTAPDTFQLIVGGGKALQIDLVERDLAFGQGAQFQPENIGRHYYPTLQQACEGAVKKLRRTGEID